MKYLSVLDSIPSKLRTRQDLISLYAYTDKAGDDNDELGERRNAAVRNALVLRGVDSIRILMVNYSESKASDRIVKEDRRVEIDINRGKLFQKYYTEALQAAIKGDYNVAQVKLNYWLKMAPPENTIYALFDCWGFGNKADIFRSALLKNLKSSKYYKGKYLKFTLDSLLCEDQRVRTLPLLLSLNYLPDFFIKCDDTTDSLRDARHQITVDHLYATYGFPQVSAVGDRANQVLPDLIMHAGDTLFQSRYLPIIHKACEDQQISWDYYAKLYDKISIARDGYQRYGTQFIIDQTGKLCGLYPFEDEQKIAEYRKQVGLVPLSDEPYLED